MIHRFQKFLVVMVMSGIAAMSAERSRATIATPFDILNGDSSYSNTGITVLPFRGANPAFFGSSGCCIGVQGGSNGVGVDDVDGIQGGSDSERLDFHLDSGYGLYGIDFVWSRANPIVLSGFVSDPLATIRNNPNGNIVATYDSASKSVLIKYPYAAGAVVDFTFGNPGASSGQTITLSVYDPGQAGPLAAINSFEWDLAALVVSGDVDGDGDVDLTDFGFIRDNWFNSSSPTKEMGDLNSDGIIEFDDFALWKEAFPFPLAGSFESGFYVVPEPAGVASIALALALLGLRRGKRGQESFSSGPCLPTTNLPREKDSRPLFLSTKLLLLISPMIVAASASPALAQFNVGFENPPYVTGTLEGQDDWTGGINFPRVQTESEIASELAAAGLNAGQTIHDGSQALLVTYNPEETSGGFVRKPFTGLASESHVAMEWWARPLTPGSEGSTIGFDLGNTFVGIMDGGEVRSAAVRFGAVRDETNAVIGTTIDYASASAGSAVWVPSGLTWESDTWYNFRFELDYTTKEYDFYIGDSKVNSTPIQFYNTNSASAAKVFVSRGQNNAGQIIDDFNVDVDLTKKLLLSINADGDAVVMNNSNKTVSIDSYTIASTSNSLLTGWESLADQSMAGWEEASPGVGRVSELNPTGELTLDPGESFTLDGLWNTAGPQDINDLVFQYRDTTRGTLSGVVAFAGAGDFDGDGDVDGRDFLTWQRNPSVGSLSDWQNNYGNGSLASVAAVPEPSAGLLAIACGFTAIAARRSYRILT